MRKALIDEFNKIFIVDLHGNSKKREISPTGDKDENVFDIQQGVSIGLFLKQQGDGNGTIAEVSHMDLWGIRNYKYHYLESEDISSTAWNKIVPKQPFYLFAHQDTAIFPEYEKGLSLRNIFPINSMGIKTNRDHLLISFERDEVENRFSIIADPSYTDDDVRNRFDIEDGPYWNTMREREKLRQVNWQNNITQILYRPFDVRWLLYQQNLIEISRGGAATKVMKHMLSGPNIAIGTTRGVEIGRGWEHIFCTSYPIQLHTVSIKESNTLFPLYLYPDNEIKISLFDLDEPSEAPGGRRPNFAPEFIADFSQKLGLSFISDGKGDRQQTFGPEDVFDYMYAVFHAPTYRSRYAEFLKIDFPRLPLTSNLDLFRALCALGDTLVGLHLMEGQIPLITRFPVAGSNLVEQVRYSEPAKAEPGRVWINKTQYVEGVTPEVWAFHVGGYQVCEKWLKDRKGRLLSFDDLSHYQRVVATLAETLRVMGEIDGVIEAGGGWPIE